MSSFIELQVENVISTILAKVRTRLHAAALGPTLLSICSLLTHGDDHVHRYAHTLLTLLDDVFEHGTPFVGCRRCIANGGNNTVLYNIFIGHYLVVCPWLRDVITD